MPAAGRRPRKATCTLFFNRFERPARYCQKLDSGPSPSHAASSRHRTARRSVFQGPNPGANQALGGSTCALQDAGEFAEFKLGDMVPGGPIESECMTGCKVDKNDLDSPGTTWKPARTVLAVFPLLFAADLFLSKSVGALAAVAVGILVLEFTDAQRKGSSYTAFERFEQATSSIRDEASIWPRQTTTRVACEVVRTTCG